jgi:lactate dehydrogenase-like 2-hydroxyacid dehydrogenase
MTDTILLATRLPRKFLAQLESRFEVLGPLPAPFADTCRSLAADEAGRVRAIVSIGAVVIPPALLERFPTLGLICCLGSGFEGVPVPEARARGIEVAHSPGANAASVADLAMTLLLSAVRDLDGARTWFAAGKFEGNTAQRLPAVRGLTGRRVGIYGLGAIGMKIAARAQAFEMEVAYHNRKQRNDVTFDWHPTLLSLATWADVLMVAVRADASNRRAIDAGILAALGADGIVVNISRGSVIDEAALVEALKAGVIRGAGLDVFEHEPAVTPGMFDLPHVALTPHIGGNTHEAQAAMHGMVLANLEAFFDGREVPAPVPG